MRTFTATIAIALVLICAPLVMGQADNPLRGVVAGAAWSDDHFSQELDFGLKTGIIVPIDMGRGLWLRTLYSRWNYRPDAPIQSIQIDVLIEFELSRSFKLYGVGESDNYVGGDNRGTDFGGGIGAAYRFYTWGEADNWFPGSLDVFTELNYVDAGSQPTGTYLGAKIGLTISRPYGK